MSFLNQLKKQKEKLKETQTTVTRVDGQRFVERGNDTKHIDSTFGFVVDTNPDDIPAKIVDCLYIGSQDCTAVNVIEKYQIKHVLSLGINVDIDSIGINHNYHKFVECLDLSETDIKQTLTECLPFVHNGVELNENVLVHCNAGVSRASMVAIAYLMHYKRMEFGDAYNLVKEKRSAIQPNAGFRDQLKKCEPGNVI